MSVTAGCANTSMASLPSGAPGMAVTTAAVALVATAAVGCNFQGCPYGSYCNTETKRCEARSCGQGCPVNTVCNEGLHLCQAPSLAKTPNDFLPQDAPSMQDFGGEQGWYGGM
jgi:hypothetical protein